MVRAGSRLAASLRVICGDSGGVVLGVEPLTAMSLTVISMLELLPWTLVMCGPSPDLRPQVAVLIAAGKLAAFDAQRAQERELREPHKPEPKPYRMSAVPHKPVRLIRNPNTGQRAVRMVIQGD